MSTAGCAGADQASVLRVVLVACSPRRAGRPPGGGWRLRDWRRSRFLCDPPPWEEPVNLQEILLGLGPPSPRRWRALRSHCRVMAWFVSAANDDVQAYYAVLVLGLFNVGFVNIIATGALTAGIEHGGGKPGGYRPMTTTIERSPQRLVLRSGSTTVTLDKDASKAAMARKLLLWARRPLERPLSDVARVTVDANVDRASGVELCSTMIVMRDGSAWRFHIRTEGRDSSSRCSERLPGYNCVRWKFQSSWKSFAGAARAGRSASAAGTPAVWKLCERRGHCPHGPKSMA